MIYSNDLKNKTILVLGGCGLIGKSIIDTISIHGSKIIILDNNVKEGKKLEKKIQKLNKNSLFIKFNLKIIKNLENNFIKILKQHKDITIFINTSYPKDKHWKKNNFDQIKFNSFRMNVDLHLNTYVFLSYIFCENLRKKNKNGSVILISSIYGLVAQDKQLYKKTNIKENFTYSVVKGGIENFTKQIAAHYGEYNIRINNISPGGVEDTSSNKQIFNSKFKSNYIKRNPIKRMCKPEDISNAVIYLSSDSSSYITGTSLVIDGGWTII